MSGADQLTRLLALLPWLRAHPGVTIEEAAAEFGVTPRQMQRDLELLIVCGLPRQGPEDLIDIQFWGEGIDVVDPQVLTRPLRLAPDEAVALIVGLRVLRDLPGRQDPSLIDGLLAKLETAAGEAAALGERVDVAIDPADTTAATVGEALSADRALHLRYLVPSREEVTDRVVDPVRVVVRGGHRYLEAWCRKVEDVRLFRLDRVVAAEVLDEPAAVPDDAAPLDLADTVFEPSPDDTQVTVEVTRAGRWLAEYAICESVTERPDGGLLITLRTPDTRWVARLVLRMGGEAQVLAPSELRTDVARRAEGLLAAYGG